MYYQGCLINDDTVPVADLTQLAGKSFSLVLPPLGRPLEIVSDRQLHLITGSRHNFKTLLIPKNQTKRFALSSKKFGIIHNMEGSEISKRVYHVEVFEVKEEGTIDIKTVDNDGTLSYEVTLLNENDQEGPGKELKGVVDTYDETKNIDKLSQIGNVGTFIGGVGRFIGGIADLVFGGKITIH